MGGRTMGVVLLGGFSVELDGVPVAPHAWRHRRAAALVKLLALTPGHRLLRDRAIEALWPTLDAQAGAANLRKAAHHARRALGLQEAVVLDGMAVHLLPGGTLDTDVARFTVAATDALGAGDVEACRQAAARYTSELLPDDPYEPWSATPRQRLAVLHREVLAGGQMWGRLLALEPTNEVAHRAVIRERLSSGDRAGAIRQFEHLRTVLREEFGVSPDPESVALYDQVLAFEGREVPTPAERARALLAWGAIHWERQDLAEAEHTAVEARALAIDAGLGRELADASELLGLVAYARGRWREVFAREFLETLRRAPDLAGFVHDANMCMSEFALHEADGLATIAAFADDVLTTAADDGSGPARALGMLLRGEAGLLGGADPAAVRSDLTMASRLHAEHGSATGRALATERLAQLEASRGDHEAATRLHRQALSLSHEAPVTTHLLPLVLGGRLETLAPDDALAFVEHADAELAGLRPCRPCSMSLHLGAVAVLARAGHLDRARARLDEASAIAGMWRAGPWHAAVAEAEAVVREAEGAAADEVRSLLQAALEGFEVAGRPREADRCRAALAAGTLLLPRNGRGTPHP